MKKTKVIHMYKDRFFESNLIRIINEEFYTNDVNIRLHLEKSKSLVRCPDSVLVTIEKEDDENCV